MGSVATVGRSRGWGRGQKLLNLDNKRPPQKIYSKKLQTPPPAPPLDGRGERRGAPMSRKEKQKQIKTDKTNRHLGALTSRLLLLRTRTSALPVELDVVVERLTAVATLGDEMEAHVGALQRAVLLNLRCYLLRVNATYMPTDGRIGLFCFSKRCVSHGN